MKRESLARRCFAEELLALAGGLLLFAGPACDAAAKSPPPQRMDKVAEKRSETMDPISMTWRLEKDAIKKVLKISYEVQNHSKEPVLLLDQTVIPQERGLELAPTRVIVRAGSEPGVVSLVKGHLRPRPGQAVAAEFTPAFRTLAPGEKATGTAEVPLPIAAWHPYMTMAPLSGPPTKAYLEIGYLAGKPPENMSLWTEETNLAGGKLKTPSVGYIIQRQAFARSDTQAIP